MRNVSLPETSLTAYKALVPESLAHDYERITFALKSLGEANYEQISHFLGWADINKCSRRLKELELAGTIYKPGTKSLTKRNRHAFNYKLVTSNEKSVEPEKAIKGESIADYSRKLIQPKLF